jgi:sugar phosphate isomerase/epimerase
MLCYSTGSLPDHFSFPQILSTLKPTPFKGVELVVTPAHLLKAHELGYWISIRQEFAAQGLCFRNVHLGHPHLLSEKAHAPGIGSLNSVGRDQKAQAILSAARIADFLSASHITLTTGLPEGDDLALQVSYLYEFLPKLIEAKSTSLKIAIEQEPEHIIHSTEQLLALCKAFPDEVFANFDIGHSAVLGESIPQCLRQLDGFICNLHLEDIVGNIHEHKLFGEGHINFDTIFNALRAQHYAGDYTPDLYPFKDDYEHAMQASGDFLKKYLGPLD